MSRICIAVPPSSEAPFTFAWSSLTRTVSASLMFGSVSALNSTSTTFPRTWTTFPVAAIMCSFLGVVCLKSCSGQGLGARDDLEKFLGDGFLTRVVHRDSQFVDQFARVFGGVVHRKQLRGVECGVGLEHRREDRELEILGQKL